MLLVEKEQLDSIQVFIRLAYFLSIFLSLYSVCFVTFSYCFIEL
jgi:hypothetical protein